MDGREISTIDLYGRSFVLLAGTGGDAWVQAAERVARELGVPLGTYRFGADLEGGNAHGIGTDGALLVHPDGFVAWRAGAVSEDPEAELEQTLSRVLGRTMSAPRGAA